MRSVRDRLVVSFGVECALSAYAARALRVWRPELEPGTGWLIGAFGLHLAGALVASWALKHGEGAEQALQQSAT